MSATAFVLAVFKSKCDCEMPIRIGMILVVPAGAIVPGAGVNTGKPVLLTIFHASNPSGKAANQR